MSLSRIIAILGGILPVYVPPPPSVQTGDSPPARI
jgi:hypothetical protein